MSQSHNPRRTHQVQSAVQSLVDPRAGASADVNGSAEAMISHKAAQNNQVRLRIAKLFQLYRDKLTSSEHSVTIMSNPESTDEKICFTVHGNEKVVPLTVKNSGVKAVYFSFRAIAFVKNIFTLRDSHGNIFNAFEKHVIGPGGAFFLEVHFCSGDAGFYEQLLVFTFETCQQSSNKFEIMRLLEVTRRMSGCEEDPLTATDASDNSVIIEPFSEKYDLLWDPHNQITSISLVPVVRLKGYAMPADIKNCRRWDRNLDTRPLNWMNYSWRCKLLLHLEELQVTRAIEKYNQNDVQLSRHEGSRDILILKIPSGMTSSLILSGLKVVVKPLNQPGGDTPYKGWSHLADSEHVYLRLRDKMYVGEDTRYSVEFTIDRTPLRFAHRAAELVYKHKLKQVLFPTRRLSYRRSRLNNLSDISISNSKNPEQCNAIQHIVACSAKPAPYLVFGPPGTGKTVTLVEAIKQILKTRHFHNILACAPSNSASDHLCEKILEGDIACQNVYRLYAFNYPLKKIPQTLKFCCNLDCHTNTLVLPNKQFLMSRHVMVTTLITAGRLVTGGIPPGHYTYIFVDEAGQATEPETIIPLAGLLNPQTCQVVLAGDPKQLGAIITSKFAEKHGLGVSLLERLMSDIELYKSHETRGFNPHFVTKLLRNYRSHPAILKIPNELFYEGELKPCACQETSWYSKWELLPKKGFPLIFHGVAGTKEHVSTSMYNTAEVDVLMGYLKSLVDHLQKREGSKIEPGEIGIIAPYRKQVEVIQKALKTDKDLIKKNVENVVVGTVEKFQGKEFNAVLVSTVRSNPKLTAQKQQFTLGFVNNEKRFNVAMTRARVLLIVVGDPRLLKTDRVWNKFIYYCSTEGAYRGITVADEEEDVLTVLPSATLREE